VKEDVGSSGIPVNRILVVIPACPESVLYQSYWLQEDSGQAGMTSPYTIPVYFTMINQYVHYFTAV